MMTPTKSSEAERTSTRCSKESKAFSASHALVQRQRHGHADDEQEAREYDIHEGVTVLPFPACAWPRPECAHPGKVVDEGHRQDDQAAEGVEGSQAGESTRWRGRHRFHARQTGPGCAWLQAEGVSHTYNLTLAPLFTDSCAFKHIATDHRPSSPVAQRSAAPRAAAARFASSSSSS